MDATMAAEARERVTKWIEETRQLFTLLPELLATDPHVNERASAAEKELDKLKKDVEDLKKENHQLRVEKDDIAQAMGQIAAKLGIAPRKSPFERTPGGEHAKPAEAAKPGEPPKAAEHPKP
jgi:chromosome segregation ATPase